MKVLMINTVPMEKNGITNVICNLVTNVNNENIQIDCVAINDVDLSYKNIFKNMVVKSLLYHKDYRNQLHI